MRKGQTPQSDYAVLQGADGIEEFSHRGIAGDRVTLRRIEYVLTTTVFMVNSKGGPKVLRS
jgi:hypothetical protein